jgi:5'/3'-nucleotidase
VLRRRAVSSLALVVLIAAGCRDDDDGGGAAAPETTVAPETTSAPETTGAPEPLAILVPDDAGIGGAGIDVLVQALPTLDDVEVSIVAPPADDVTAIAAGYATVSAVSPDL